MNHGGSKLPPGGGSRGQSRITFGFPELQNGIDAFTVVVGLVAVGETFWIASRIWCWR